MKYCCDELKSVGYTEIQFGFGGVFAIFYKNYEKSFWYNLLHILRFNIME
jgi:hypothetical protein